MKRETTKPAEKKAPETAKEKTLDTSVLSNDLHDSVYQVPNDMKKWFAFKGKKVYAQDREKYLSPDVVTWNEVRDGRDAYRDDDFDKSMFDDLRNYCYTKKFKSQIANPKVVDEDTQTTYQVPGSLKQWFNQSRLKIEDALAEAESNSIINSREYYAYNRESSNNSSNENIDGTITLKELNAFLDGSNRSDDSLRKLAILSESFYRQRFNGKMSNTVTGDTGYVYQVPEPFKKWFDQNRYFIDNIGDDKANGVITTQELYAYANNSPEDSDTRKQVKALDVAFYNQRFKSKMADTTVSGDHGFIHKIPAQYKTWFDQNRMKFDLSVDDTRWDGVVSTDELMTCYKNTDNDDDRKQLADLLKLCHQQRFKKVNLVNEHYGTTYELPAHLQKWLNQNGWELDMMTGTPDGRITDREVGERSGLLSTNTKMFDELLTYAQQRTSNDEKAMVKSFETQVSKDPESLRSWYKQHKNELDYNNDGITTDSELAAYTSKPMNTIDRTMVLGLSEHAKTLQKMTSHDVKPGSLGFDVKSYFSGQDVETVAKLTSHKMTPEQAAFDNTIEPTKAAATIGAIAGGSLGFLSTARIAYNVLQGWGASSAGVALGTVTRRTVGGAILGGLAGAAITAGIGFGLNYYQANNWISERNKTLRDNHLMGI